MKYVIGFGASQLIIFSIFEVYQFIIFIAFFIELYAGYHNKPSMGLAQQGRCSLYGYDYYIQEMSLSNISSSQNLTAPVLFNGPSYSCIGDEHIKNCTILLTSPILHLPSNLFEKYFSLSNDNKSIYGNDATVLVFGSMIFLALHILSSVVIFLAPNHNSTNSRIFEGLMYSPVLSGFIVFFCLLIPSYDFQLLHNEKCEDIVTLSTEALTICHSIGACGLTIVSLNYINGTSLYGYITMSRLLAYYTGLTMLLYFVFLLICDVVSVIANRCEAHRQSIIGKRGSERDIALEKAPNWFVNEYLPPPYWRYVSNPSPSNRYD